jgi:hypothetical protein
MDQESIKTSRRQILVDQSQLDELLKIELSRGKVSYDAVRILISCGADPNCDDDRGYNAVHQLIIGQRHSSINDQTMCENNVMQLLIEAGCKLDGVVNGETPLETAIRLDKANYVLILMQESRQHNIKIPSNLLRMRKITGKIISLAKDLSYNFTSNKQDSEDLLVRCIEYYTENMNHISMETIHILLNVGIDIEFCNRDKTSPYGETVKYTLFKKIRREWERCLPLIILFIERGISIKFNFIDMIIRAFEVVSRMYNPKLITLYMDMILALCNTDYSIYTKHNIKNTVYIFFVIYPNCIQDLACDDPEYDFRNVFHNKYINCLIHMFTNIVDDDDPDEYSNNLSSFMMEWVEEGISNDQILDFFRFIKRLDGIKLKRVNGEQIIFTNDYDYFLKLINERAVRQHPFHDDPTLYNFMLANNYFHRDNKLAKKLLHLHKPLTPDKYMYLIPKTMAIIETVTVIRSVCETPLSTIPNEILFEIFSHLNS